MKMIPLVGALFALAACASLPNAGTMPEVSRFDPNFSGANQAARAAHNVDGALETILTGCTLPTPTRKKLNEVAIKNGLAPSGMRDPFPAESSAQLMLEEFSGEKNYVGLKWSAEDVQLQSYSCGTQMRGDWTARVAPILSSELRRMGFRSVAAINPDAESSNHAVNVWRKRADVREFYVRNGQRYELLISSWGGGRKVTDRGNVLRIGVSGTVILLVANSDEV